MKRNTVVPLVAATAILGGALLVGTAHAAEVTKPTSSCVACHTDSARLQEEAKGIPIPTGSALQAGKG